MSETDSDTSSSSEGDETLSTTSRQYASSAHWHEKLTEEHKNQGDSTDSDSDVPPRHSLNRYDSDSSTSSDSGSETNDESAMETTEAQRLPRNSNQVSYPNRKKPKVPGLQSQETVVGNNALYSTQNRGQGASDDETSDPSDDETSDSSDDEIEPTQVEVIQSEIEPTQVEEVIDEYSTAAMEATQDESSPEVPRKLRRRESSRNEHDATQRESSPEVPRKLRQRESNRIEHDTTQRESSPEVRRKLRRWESSRNEHEPTQDESSPEVRRKLRRRESSRNEHEPTEDESSPEVPRKLRQRESNRNEHEHRMIKKSAAKLNTRKSKRLTATKQRGLTSASHDPSSDGDSCLSSNASVHGNTTSDYSSDSSSSKASSDSYALHKVTSKRKQSKGKRKRPRVTETPVIETLESTTGNALIGRKVLLRRFGLVTGFQGKVIGFNPEMKKYHVSLGDGDFQYLARREFSLKRKETKISKKKQTKPQEDNEDLVRALKLIGDLRVQHTRNDLLAAAGVSFTSTNIDNILDELLENDVGLRIAVKAQDNAQAAASEAEVLEQLMVEEGIRDIPVSFFTFFRQYFEEWYVDYKKDYAAEITRLREKHPKRFRNKIGDALPATHFFQEQWKLMNQSEKDAIREILQVEREAMRKDRENVMLKFDSNPNYRPKPNRQYTSNELQQIRRSKKHAFTESISDSLNKLRTAMSISRAVQKEKDEYCELEENVNRLKKRLKLKRSKLHRKVTREKNLKNIIEDIDLNHSLNADSTETH